MWQVLTEKNSKVIIRSGHIRSAKLKLHYLADWYNLLHPLPDQ